MINYRLSGIYFVQESRNQPDRLEKHKKLIQKFTEGDAKLPPWFTPEIKYPKSISVPKFHKSFNPAFQLFLEFFSEPAQFLGIASFILYYINFYQGARIHIILE